MTALGKHRGGWYVIQVRSTTESAMCERITRACKAHDEAAEAAEDAAGYVGLHECFSPRFVTQRKWKGEWTDIEQLLLPGYVIADVENPGQLAAAISGIRDLCKLLNGGETYAPLDESERVWLDAQTSRENRVIPMSFARKAGDKLEILEGPLKGREAIIAKVDRQNSLAHLELHIGQMTIKTKVGLAVMPSRETKVNDSKTNSDRRARRLG